MTMRDVQSKGNTKNRVRTRKKQLCSESRPALRAARRALHSAACERTPRSWRPSKTPAAWQPLPALWSSTPSLALGVGVLTLRRYGGRERGKGEKGGGQCAASSAIPPDALGSVPADYLRCKNSVNFAPERMAFAWRSASTCGEKIGISRIPQDGPACGCLRRRYRHRRRLSHGHFERKTVSSVLQNSHRRQL